MHPQKGNPGSLAAARASERFCSADKAYPEVSTYAIDLQGGHVIDRMAEGDLDSIEVAINRAAVAALRRRVDRQARIAQAETTTAERGARAMSGEGRIAQRLAEAFSELADELDGAPR